MVQVRVALSSQAVDSAEAGYRISIFTGGCGGVIARGESEGNCTVVTCDGGAGSSSNVFKGG